MLKLVKRVDSGSTATYIACEFDSHSGYITKDIIVNVNPFIMYIVNGFICVFCLVTI